MSRCVLDDEDRGMPDDGPARIEFEVNRQLGGDATVGEIVTLMLHLGWQPSRPEPTGILPDQRVRPSNKR